MSDIFKLEAAHNRLLAKCQYLETAVDGHRQFNTALQQRIAAQAAEIERLKVVAEECVSIIEVDSRDFAPDLTDLKQYMIAAGYLKGEGE